MSTDDFEIVITVRSNADLDEESVTIASRYLVERAVKHSPDRRIDWLSARVRVGRLQKGAE